MKEILYCESLSVPDGVFIDVRSPEEFEIDHVNSAINIPLFENEERKEVGTIYRFSGREDAILRGTRIVGDKLQDLIQSFLSYEKKNIILMCARGGMRSTSLGSLLDSLGMNIFKIKDGYKGYRHYVIDRLESLTLQKPLFVLQGLTGSGKTEIIRKLENGVDLEDMAGHRSSVFGGIGLAQKSQKHFESLLIGRLDDLADAPYLVIEGESRKIGNLHIPDVLFRDMQKAPSLMIDTPLEKRIDVIVDEYRSHCDDKNIPAIVNSLQPKLGQKQVERLLALYEEGDIREFIRVLLEKYYDPLYRYTLEKKDSIAEIRNNDTDETVGMIRGRINEFLAINR